MKIHEYQAKELFRKAGIRVPEGRMAKSLDEALKAADEMGGDKFVVKAQIHAGGRYKGGGVKIVNSRNELKDAVNSILGMRLVSVQTGPRGQLVRMVYIEKRIEVERELYLGVVANRSHKCFVLTASQAGGTEIEIVASHNPEKILQERADPTVGLQPFQCRKICAALRLEKGTAAQAADIAMKLYVFFRTYDCSVAEIDPLIVTPGGDVYALDSKVNFDDNALFRHPELSELEDPLEMDPLELEAEKYGFSYVRLDGNIGCMVNGAGLAMGINDLVSFSGGKPANFLDIGGGAEQERVTRAFQTLLSDEGVRVILVNIFGGITRCPTVAEGIIQATKNLALKLPLVVCLKGTEQEEGRKIIAESGLNIQFCETMEEAAKMAVDLAKKAEGVRS